MITLEQTRWHRRCLTSSRPQKGGPKMTTPIGYSVAIPRYAMSNASIGQAYRTKSPSWQFTSIPLEKERLFSYPEGVMIRVIGPSFCLREGFEVVFAKQFYNVFEVDLLARCSQIFEPDRSHAVAA